MLIKASLTAESPVWLVKTTEAQARPQTSWGQGAWNSMLNRHAGDLLYHQFGELCCWAGTQERRSHRVSYMITFSSIYCIPLDSLSACPPEPAGAPPRPSPSPEQGTQCSFSVLCLLSESPLAQQSLLIEFSRRWLGTEVPWSGDHLWIAVSLAVDRGTAWRRQCCITTCRTHRLSGVGHTFGQRSSWVRLAGQEVLATSCHSGCWKLWREKEVAASEAGGIPHWGSRRLTSLQMLPEALSLCLACLSSHHQLWLCCWKSVCPVRPFSKREPSLRNQSPLHHKSPTFLLDVLVQGLLACSAWHYDFWGLSLIPFLCVQTLNPTLFVLFQSNC